MAIIYVSSMDQYGPMTATDDAPATPNAVTVTWQMDNEIMLGDGWSNEPSNFNNNFRFEPSGTYTLSTPSFGARKGERAFVANSVQVSNEGFEGTDIASQACWPLVIPGATSTVRRMHFAYGVDTLPDQKGVGWILWGLTAANERRFGLKMDSSGRLQVYDGVDMSGDISGTNGYDVFPTLLGTSQSPVFEANTWYSINIQTTTNAIDATMDIEVWVGEITAGNKVIDLSGVAATDTTGGVFGAANNIDIWGHLPVDMSYFEDGIATHERAMRDIVLHDSSGTYNTGMLGQVFVSVQETRFETPGGGWTAHPRDNLGTGVLDVTTGQGLRIADNAAFEFGAGEFTVEGRWRFDAIPETGEKVLISKWEADTNNREWKLVYDTTLDTLRWMISTDGTTETILWEYPVQDLIDFRKWYEIAVSREVVSGVGTLRVYIDGVQYGVDVTDSNTYHAGPAELGIGAAYNDASTLVTASAFAGYMDEIRITKGVGRYTGATYTPVTEKFGREVADDASFASVSLLLGFDGSITDESSNAWTVNAETDVAFVEPDDDDYSFSVLNQVPPVDDGYIESKQGRATAVLTLTGQPLNTETVTLGSVTYTFQTVLVDSANNVLIGATVEESLENLIAAVQAGAGAGTTYGTGTTANTDVIGQAVFDPQGFFQAQTLGAAGNSLASTETLTNGSFNAATFEGGSDIPAASDFSMERLPAEVTGVLGIQFTGRAYKSDAGAAQVRFDLVGPSAAVDTGTGLDSDLSPTWVRQVFEEDPDTSATITPSTIVGGKVRLTRTT